MSNVVADAAGISAYGSTEAAVAAQIASAGGINVAAVAGILTPVFGALGTEHLIATLIAMSTNLFETGQVSAVHAGQAAAAYGSAAAYTATDLGDAAEFGAIGLNL
ncbi:hypothetical protein [Gordonia soli]|uniref:PE domain-containing protein n=1 Tax=Gordonia soli NBRC 108243 TaxID=1223545 RepID=M0QLP6_9ACTN|nr:hypothetical protein [Gordonia soli]GAC69334.1 hypothetical protein GS4_23_01310 [Gordonia soli NBRC 108243]